ncbi:hypothetical protein MUK42_37490 [Musa troglodytarum]|uniref:GIR1-like zinc ribbon domain-containing protein n=1 Tax=Musa troglodytarum TaxID=320322 RepID=A0A9E7HA52_9LILI|nr:hypothetical protein MUK42_37490 [Musa troglodytarum]
MQSGRTYLQKRHHDPVTSHRHDLNLTLPPRSSATHFLEQRVCTLEKVKSALERAGREERPPAGRLPDSSPSPPSQSVATSSSMAADRREDGHGRDPESLPAAMAVAGCPVCLLYVLVSAVDPRCPRCAAHVPVHNEPKKRPKFDLNQLDDGVDDLN